MLKHLGPFKAIIFPEKCFLEICVKEYFQQLEGSSHELPVIAEVSEIIFCMCIHFLSQKKVVLSFFEILVKHGKLNYFICVSSKVK